MKFLELIIMEKIMARKKSKHLCTRAEVVPSSSKTTTFLHCCSKSLSWWLYFSIPY